jgi:hypothetical protein
VAFGEPAVHVGEGMAGEEIASARGEQGDLVGKVAVHRQPLDSRPERDGAHGRSDRTHLPVELQGCVDDPSTGQRLAVGPLPQLVAARRPDLHSLIVAVQWNADGPDSRSAIRRLTGQAVSRMSPMIRSRRAVVRLRWTGSDASQAGICLWVITAQLAVRSMDVSGATTAAYTLMMKS